MGFALEVEVCASVSESESSNARELAEVGEGSGRM